MTKGKRVNKRIMKNWRSLVLAWGFFLAAFGLAFYAVRAKNQADASGSVTVYLETPLSGKDSQALRKLEDEMEFTAWGELPDVEVVDPDLGKKTKTEALVLDGPSELVLPLAPVLSQGDTAGCLIGEETAWELFGSTQVAGDKICIGNEARIIRGVVSQPQVGVVLGGDIGDIMDMQEESAVKSYDRITLSGGTVSDAEEFLLKNSLDGQLLRLDCLRSLHWAAELVPGKWSDFSGWKNNFLQKKEEFRLLSKVQKNSIELFYERQCLLYVCNTAAELICIVAAAACLDNCLAIRYNTLVKL